MVDVLQGTRPTAKVLMMTGTQKHQHERSNLQEPHLSSAETTPVQLDEAEREGVEPFKLEFAKELFNMGRRGHHIHRKRRNDHAKLLLILQCTVYAQGQLAFIKLISALGHTLQSGWF